MRGWVLVDHLPGREPVHSAHRWTRANKRTEFRPVTALRAG